MEVLKYQECNINNALTCIIKNRFVEIRSMEKLYKKFIKTISIVS